MALIRFSNQLAQPLSVRYELIEPFYDAYRHLGQIIDSGRYRATLATTDGDLLTAHAHRVLHGRLPYDPTSGARHLQDVYLEFDDFLARRRVLRGEYRAGEDEQTVVCALVHDIGDLLAPANHSEVAAAMVRPYVSDRNYWIMKHHGLFQGVYWFHHVGADPNARERYAEHRWYQACVEFCANYDQNSFDPGYPTEPLEFFAPMVRRVFAADRIRSPELTG